MASLEKDELRGRWLAQHRQVFCHIPLNSLFGSLQASQKRHCRFCKVCRQTVYRADRARRRRCRQPTAGDPPARPAGLLGAGLGPRRGRGAGLPRGEGPDQASIHGRGVRAEAEETASAPMTRRARGQRTAAATGLAASPRLRHAGKRRQTRGDEQYGVRNRTAAIEAVYSVVPILWAVNIVILNKESPVSNPVPSRTSLAVSSAIIGTAARPFASRSSPKSGEAQNWR